MGLHVFLAWASMEDEGRVECKHRKKDKHIKKSAFLHCLVVEEYNREKSFFELVRFTFRE